MHILTRHLSSRIPEEIHSKYAWYLSIFQHRPEEQHECWTRVYSADVTSNDVTAIKKQALIPESVSLLCFYHST